MKNLNPDFYQPFVDGAIETFKVQCETDVKADKPYYKGEGRTFKFGIAGLIGLTCKDFSGTIALCFQEKVFLSMMSKMLGEEIKEINGEIRDGAAELMNIVFGRAKMVLNEAGYEIELAIPTVLSGKEIETHILGQSPPIVIPMETDSGQLAIEISISDEKK